MQAVVSTQQSYAGAVGVVQAYDLRRLIEEAIGMSDAAFVNHGIDVAVDLEALEPAFIDRHKVMQILINLLSNAKHALAEREDGRRIDIRLATIGDGRFAIEVEDNGVGIAPENRDRIFTNGFTTKENGSGLGLAMALKLMDRHEGSIDIASEPGCGTAVTSFRITIF